jgi:hypothetical protein
MWIILPMAESGAPFPTVRGNLVPIFTSHFRAEMYLESHSDKLREHEVVHVYGKDRVYDALQRLEARGFDQLAVDPLPHPSQLLVVPTRDILTGELDDRGPD